MVVLDVTHRVVAELLQRERLLQLLRRPYDDHGYLAAEAYAAPPPDWLQDTALTWSS